jgi:hypothetical protein
MASIGATFFGGLDVVALAVAVVGAAAMCWAIQRSAGSSAESVD